MKSVRLLLPLTALAVVLTAARADERETASIKFSDPAQPGTLKVALANGDVRIRGVDADEITVRTDLKPESPAQRKDGLRVLTSSSSYSLVEKNNVVTLSYGTGGWPGSGGEFDVTVPRATHVVISSGLGGDITVDDVTGDLEIKSLNGEISLNNVAGGALVETMNGEIKVNVRALVENKPLSFTSMNGEIRLNVPVDAKADVNFRTHNGSILTDFDSKQLVTKTASLRAEKYGTHALSSADAAEIRHAVRDAVRMGMDAAREATRAAREGLREAQRTANAANNNSDNDEPKEPEDVADNDSEDGSAVAPVPPVPPLPPMTGGKIVSGTLNGGGTKIMVATMNGDVTLRKLEPKP